MKSNRLIKTGYENGDFEVYILYPENAIADINHEELLQKSNAGSKTVLQAKVSSCTTIKNCSA
jgi:hypothetical protein